MYEKHDCYCIVVSTAVKPVTQCVSDPKYIVTGKRSVPLFVDEDKPVNDNEPVDDEPSCCKLDLASCPGGRCMLSGSSGFLLGHQ